MKSLSKTGVTLAALTALGLAGSQAAQAGLGPAGSQAAQAASPTTVTYLGTILNQPNVGLVGTSAWVLPNFSQGSDTSPAISQANPLDSNGVEVLDSLGALGSIDSNGITGTDTASNAAAGGFAAITAPVPGYLGVAYDMPGQDVFNFGTGSVNTNAYMQAETGTKTFTFGVVVSSNAAPTTISAYFWNGITGATSSLVTATTVPTTNLEADYYLFHVTNLSANTGCVYIDAAPSTTGGIAGISGLTLGTPSVAITPPASVPEASSFIGFGLLLSLGGLSIVACTRTAKV